MTVEFLDEITEAFHDYDEDLLKEKIVSALDSGVGAVTVLGWLSDILEGIGEKFSRGEAFLPELVASGDMMDASVVILKPKLLENQAYEPTGVKIILGSVRGDIHTIGKNMVKMIWVASGFEVIDLGVDVPAETFLFKAQEVNPDFVALSSTMTTTIPSMKDTIDLFKSKKLDEKYKILVGGGSVNESLAASVGAFAYGGRDAYESVKTIKSILDGTKSH